ncbi:MAG: hypothetical protein NTW87_16255 [Planctomycetota bacterium]|nr:hypothetical protein [Planctomycetota bacterium]
MRKFLAICVALCVLAAGRLAASEGVDDLAKLIKSGVTEDVLLAYVQASPVAYQLTVDEILYLNDIGASQKVIAAVMQRGEDLRLAAAKGEPPPVRKVEPPPPAIADLPPVAKEEPPAVKPPAPPPEEARPAEPPAEAADLAPQAPVIGRPEPEVRPLEVAPAPLAPLPAQVARDENIENEVAPAREVVREVVVERPYTGVVAPPADGVTVSYFYESLSPYGRWIQVGHAWVWQPTVMVVDRGWRPYFHRGHWVHTDFGWTWHSDYSWGWAAFHYGRWSCDPAYGWVWTPDTVWGPAWVNWRMSDTHYAWAPLPPAARYEAGVGFFYHDKHVSVGFDFGLGERDYHFVPAQRFCERSLTPYALPRDQVAHAYNNTTIIQNNYVYNDNRIINQGPAVDRVRAATGQPVNQVRLVDAEAKPGQQLHGEALTGDRMALFRPKVSAATPETPPAVLARREATAKRQQEARLAAEGRKDAREDKRETVQAQHEAQKAAPARDAAELRKQQVASANEARKQKEAAEAADREKDRLEKAADREGDQKQREATRAAAQAEKQKAADARKRQQDAEDQAEARDKAAKSAAKDQERLARQAEDAAREAQRKRDNEAARQQEAAGAATQAAKRDQERRDAQAREDAQDAQRKAETAAKAAAREQTRRDAQAKEDAVEAQRKAEAAAKATARGQARVDAQAQDAAQDAQRKAETAAKATAREQARRDAQAQDAAQDAQRKADADARRPQRTQPQPTAPAVSPQPAVPGVSPQPTVPATQPELSPAAQRQAEREARRTQDTDSTTRPKTSGGRRSSRGGDTDQ